MSAFATGVLVGVLATLFAILIGGALLVSWCVRTLARDEQAAEAHWSPESERPRG